MTTTGDTWDTCHILLKRALLAAHPEERPPGPYGLGGPPPVCAQEQLVELGLWCFALLEPSVTGLVDQALARRIADDVRTFLWKHQRLPLADARARGLGRTLNRPTDWFHYRLFFDSRPIPDEATPMAVVRLVAGAAAAMGRGTDLTPHLEEAVSRVITFLREAPPGSAMRVREFLSALDATLVRLECRAAIAARLPAGVPVPEVAEVLWRQAGSQRRAQHFIARLEDGAWGLVTKIGHRWTWVRGARDEVLASVPDEYFEAATRAAMARVTADD
ncbi:hypothetical protein LZ198_16100 [Myxococcus sp. K15C18031901]|uniref:hypothetical protein n=1 Tax=Myxococcus dinghuensis TaxID=2906761 RepID=UPI0020A7E6C6|nr:hypothetical protein [Myxococcus dinghuensis]MCP3100392.1 hypothetical protein [Myxococcus dinghuensis]